MSKTYIGDESKVVKEDLETKKELQTSLIRYADLLRDQLDLVLLQNDLFDYKIQKHREAFEKAAKNNNKQSQWMNEWKTHLCWIFFDLPNKIDRFILLWIFYWKKCLFFSRNSSAYYILLNIVFLVNEIAGDFQNSTDIL